MGHAPNINRNPRKLAELRAKLRAESAAGWTRKADGTLQAVETIGGCLARGAQVLGRCTKAPGCYRRVTVDLVWLCEHGFGLESVYEITKSYSCGRMGGCKVEFGPSTYPGGTPLRALADPHDHLLQFRCCNCDGEGYRRSATSLLLELRRRGREDADRVGAHVLAKRMQRVCIQCGGREWRAVVSTLPPRPDGAADLEEEAEGDAAEPASTARGWKSELWRR